MCLAPTYSLPQNLPHTWLAPLITPVNNCSPVIIRISHQLATLSPSWWLARRLVMHAWQLAFWSQIVTIALPSWAFWLCCILCSTGMVTAPLLKPSSQLTPAALSTTTIPVLCNNPSWSNSLSHHFTYYILKLVFCPADKTCLFLGRKDQLVTWQCISPTSYVGSCQ